MYNAYMTQLACVWFEIDSFVRFMMMMLAIALSLAWRFLTYM